MLLDWFRFACSFYAVIDLASVLPWWINLGIGNGSSGSTFFRALRLVRMLKADQYEHAFDKFDDVFAANKDLLIVSGFAALVMWIFFSSLMYFTEFKLPHTPNNQLLTAPDVLTKLEGCLRGIVDPPSDMPACHYPLHDSDIPCGDMTTCVHTSADPFTCNCIPYQRYRYKWVCMKSNRFCNLFYCTISILRVATHSAPLPAAAHTVIAHCNRRAHLMQC